MSDGFWEYLNHSYGSHNQGVDKNNKNDAWKGILTLNQPIMQLQNESLFAN